MIPYDPNNPSTKGRPCPLMGKKCPGSPDGCAFWRTQEVKIDDRPRLIQNCLFVLQFEATYQNVAEEIRIQNSIQHFNNQVYETASALAQGRHPVALSGNFDEDGEHIKEISGADSNPPSGPRSLPD